MRTLSGAMPKPPRPVLVQRSVLVRGAWVGAIIFIAMLSYAAVAMRRALLAERLAGEAAHASSVQFVRLAMELQAELDEQEDHYRRVLQLYLSLEREHLPDLQHKITSAAKECSNPAAAQAATRALADFGEQAHQHSNAMLDALQRQASRAHRRAQELAQSMLSQARADRERVRQSGQGHWSDADLEGPLLALYRRLRRPNATFELPLPTLSEWERAFSDVMHEGGAAGDPKLHRRLLTLAAEAPLPRDDPDRAELTRTAGAHDDPTNAFVSMLHRARLHRHLPELLAALKAFAAHERTVWDVIEHIERLRAQHVFPMAMLRLAEHEWDALVGGAADTAGREARAFDADQ